MGAVFFGESMFCRRSNASKMALVATAHLLLAKGYQVIDCQVESDHLNSLGARNIPQQEFERYLDPSLGVEPPSPWQYDSPMEDHL